MLLLKNTDFLVVFVVLYYAGKSPILITFAGQVGQICACEEARELHKICIIK